MCVNIIWHANVTNTCTFGRDLYAIAYQRKKKKILLLFIFHFICGGGGGRAEESRRVMIKKN